MAYRSLCADDLKMIEKYSDMVYKLSFSLTKNKYDADDIHQEVFIRYLCKHPVFSGEEHEKAWFLRVTINLSRNLWKSAWRQNILEPFDIDITAGQADEFTIPDEEDSIIDLVKRLPYKYKIVIHLFYYEELSIEEIAKILKLKPSTVRTQLTRARKKLETMIKEDNYDWSKI